MVTGICKVLRPPVSEPTAHQCVFYSCRGRVYAASSKSRAAGCRNFFYGNKDFTLPNLASIHSLGNSAERIFRYIYDVLVVYSSSFIAGFDDK